MHKKGWFILKRHSKTLKGKKENEYIRDIIISQSNFYLTEDDFILGYLEETDIMINIDEKYFKIDGIDFTDWCKRHFIVLSESDKTIRIDGFKH